MQTEETRGARLRRHRQLAKLTQRQVAADVGVRPNTVYRWEKDRARPTDEHYTRLAELFRVKESRLMFG